MNFYKILDVKQDATSDEIRKAYLIKAKTLHPDKNNGRDYKFKELNNAYNILADPEKRKNYDDTNLISKASSIFSQAKTGLCFEAQDLLEAVQAGNITLIKSLYTKNKEYEIFKGTYNISSQLKCNSFFELVFILYYKNRHHNNYAKITEALITSGAEICAEIGNLYTIIMAIENKYYAILERCLEKDIDYNIVSDEGLNLISTVFTYLPISYIQKTLDSLIAQKTNRINYADISKMPIKGILKSELYAFNPKILLAIWLVNDDKFSKYFRTLFKDNCNFDETDIFGNEEHTALTLLSDNFSFYRDFIPHAAKSLTYKERILRIKELLNHGAEVNILYGKNKSPLINAVTNGCIELVNIFLNHKAPTLEILNISIQSAKNEEIKKILQNYRTSNYFYSYDIINGGKYMHRIESVNSPISYAFDAITSILFGSTYNTQENINNISASETNRSTSPGYRNA